jgi:hypothetical protein
MLTKMNQKKALDLIERGEGEKQPELWKNPLVNWNSHYTNSETVFSTESINATNNRSIAVEIQNEKTDMIPIFFKIFIIWKPAKLTCHNCTSGSSASQEFQNSDISNQWAEIRETFHRHEPDLREEAPIPQFAIPPKENFHNSSWTGWGKEK